jgi:N-acyl-L-homoserine lactone synthetase
MNKDHPTQAVLFREADQPDLAYRVFRLRKSIFVDKCGWDLPTEGDLERDEFDGPQAVHCALLLDDEAIGTFRALRTDRPYLGAIAFPQLASVHPYPRRSDYWEITRFGIADAWSGRHTARCLYAVMFAFAQRAGATGLVAIADLTYERFLASIGIRTRRYGAPQVIGTDRFGTDLIAVAGEIPIAAQSGERFARLWTSLEHVEIIDASEVFGPFRISA